MKTGNENCKHLMNLVKINHSFIPLVHDKRKDFRISKQLEVLGGNHAELSIQKNTFF